MNKLKFRNACFIVMLEADKDLSPYQIVVDVIAKYPEFLLHKMELYNGDRAKCFKQLTAEVSANVLGRTEDIFLVGPVDGKYGFEFFNRG
jgi:hypothetical protein